MFFSHFYKRNNFCNFLFASLNDKAIQKWVLFIKKNFTPMRANSFFKEIIPIEKEGKMKMAELFSMKYKYSP